MNVVLLLAHAIEEMDQVRLLDSLGYGVFSIGAYTDPAHPSVDIRPPLPDVPHHADLERACVEVRERHAGEDTAQVIDWAKYELPAAVLDWADVLIVHHFEHTWLVPQWARLSRWKREKSHRRIIWRTVGQSVEHNERMMKPLRDNGLERVAYSPKEANIPGYSGHDALIRFYKDPAEWDGWTGEWPGVINFTQGLYQRQPFTNYQFWHDATKGLARPFPGLPEDGPPPPFAYTLGPGSEVLGGGGEQTYDEMRAWLRRARCYLYLGTQPASYTLGLIEAMMTGIPVVSIGPSHMQVFPYGPDLFEGHELAGAWSEDPYTARKIVDMMLDGMDAATDLSREGRARAIDLFGIDTIGPQWKAFLG